MSPLNTSNPVALQFFMTDTVFGLGIDVVQLAPELAAPVKKEVEFKVFGGNQRHILFIVSAQEHDFFSEEAELAFIKTMKAMKLDYEDVAVINVFPSNSPFLFEKIKAKLKPESCVLLGAEPPEVGLENFADHLWKEEEGVRFLKSYSFEEMLTDMQKKRLFWDSIKLMSL